MYRHGGGCIRYECDNGEVLNFTRFIIIVISDPQAAKWEKLRHRKHYKQLLGDNNMAKYASNKNIPIVHLI